jgi:hypothetical protein
VRPQRGGGGEGEENKNIGANCCHAGRVKISLYESFEEPFRCAVSAALLQASSASGSIVTNEPIRKILVRVGP